MPVGTGNNHAGATALGQRQQSTADIAVNLGNFRLHTIALQPALQRTGLGDRAGNVTFQILGCLRDHDMAQCADQRQVKAHSARGAIAAIPCDDDRPAVLELIRTRQNHRQARVHQNMLESQVERLAAFRGRARKDDSLCQCRSIRARPFNRIDLVEEIAIEPVRTAAHRVMKRYLRSRLHGQLQVDDALRCRCGQAGRFRCRRNHQHGVRVRQGKQSSDRRIQPPRQFNGGQGRLTVLRFSSLQYGNNRHGTSTSG